MIEAKENIEETPISNEEIKDRNKLLKFLGFFVFMIIMVYVFADKGTQVERFDCPDKSDALEVAKGMIKTKLPTNSGTFPNEPRFNCNSSDLTYNFEGLIDFVNLLNAPLRRKYNIKIKYLGGDTENPINYKLIDYSLTKPE